MERFLGTLENIRCLSDVKDNRHAYTRPESQIQSRRRICAMFSGCLRGLKDRPLATKCRKDMSIVGES